MCNIRDVSVQSVQQVVKRKSTCELCVYHMIIFYTS